MSTPDWLPPLNSHPQCQVLTDASAEIPEYDPYRPRPLYSIKIIISVIFKSADDSSNQRTFQGLSCEKKFTIPSHLVDSESIFKERVLEKLTHDETLIPFEVNLDALACFVWDFACWMKLKLRKITPPYNILPLNLEITKEVKLPDNELEAWNSWYDEKKRVDPNFEKGYKDAISRQRTIEELTYETSAWQFRAAAPSSIQELEVVRLDNVSSNSACTICLEELVLESKITRLPCSHVFHGECIVKWLEESHMCPLCRFELPYV